MNRVANLRASPIMPLRSLEESGGIRIGPSTASEPTRIPGLVERVNLIRNLKLREDDPSLITFVPEHNLIAFTKETGVGLNLMAPFLQGRESYRLALSRGLLEKFVDILQGYRVIDEVEKVDHVPIGEIHCPKLIGCKATYIHETVTQDDHFLNIKILSLGGGSGITSSIGTGYAITTEMGCSRIFIPVKIKIQVRQPLKGNAFRTADIVEILPGYMVRKMRERHFCKINFKYVQKANLSFEPYSLRTVVGTHKTSKLIDIGKKTDFSWAISIKEIGFEIGLTISVEVVKKVKYEYELAGGYDYIGFFPMPNSSLFCWTWR